MEVAKEYRHEAPLQPRLAFFSCCWIVEGKLKSGGQPVFFPGNPEGQETISLSFDFYIRLPLHNISLCLSLIHMQCSVGYDEFNDNNMYVVV